MILKNIKNEEKFNENSKIMVYKIHTYMNGFVKCVKLVNKKIKFAKHIFYCKMVSKKLIKIYQKAQLQTESLKNKRMQCLKTIE